MKIEMQNKTRAGRRQAQPSPAMRPGSQIVHFELTNPSASKVCVAGSFNDWKPELGEMIRLDDGKWVKDMMIEPGTYEYRLIVDGQWMPDPQADHSVVNAFGERNSLLTVS